MVNRILCQTDAKERTKRTSEDSAQITSGTERQAEKEFKGVLQNPCPREKRWKSEPHNKRNKGTKQARGWRPKFKLCKICNRKQTENVSIVSSGRSCISTSSNVARVINMQILK